MVFYLTIWSLVALASFFDVTTLSLKKKKMIALCIFSLSVVLGATRNQVGTDWEQYYYLFVHNTSFADYFEVNTVYETGYMALNYIAHLISDEYVMLLFLMTLIICVLKYKTFFAIAQYPLVVIMLDYSYNLGNIFPVRQSIAIAIVLFSVLYIINKKPVNFTATFILANFFHRTAIVFLPAYFLFYKKINTKKLLIFLIIFSSLGFLFSDILTSYISTLVTNSFFVEKFIAYSTDVDNSFGAAADSTTRLITSTLKKVAVLVILWSLKKKAERVYPYYNGLFNLYFVSNLLYLFFVPIAPEIALRIVPYYNIFEYFLLASLIGLSKKWWIKLLVLLTLIAYGLLKYVTGIDAFYDLFVPYNTILYTLF